jgi:ribosomal protein S18 acetylase RimI-like enzyme
MPLRTLELPADLRAVAAFIPLAFQYPENETWNIRPDEVDGLLDTLNTLSRLWPLIRPAQSVSPSLRDVLSGHIWEENGRLVGLTIFQRYGTTDTWFISNVAVLPDYRRQGIGRKLLRATLDSIRRRGGKVALLKVIAGNVPAYTLYEQLGFERYTSSVVLDYDRDELPPELPLPRGHVVSSCSRLAWQVDYRLAQRIVPTSIRRYEPVEEARFRRAWPEHVLMSIIWKATGVKKERLVVRIIPDDQTVALVTYSAKTRSKGASEIAMSLDPDHAGLAPYLMNRLIYTTRRLSPGRRIKLEIPQWQHMVVKAAYAAGCVKRLEQHGLGMILPG